MGARQRRGLDPVLKDILVCPRDGSRLTQAGDELISESGHRYQVVNGIPVMLVQEAEITHPIFEEAFKDEVLEKYRETGDATPLSDGQVHPFVQNIIVGTCGHLYEPLKGRLKSYPIPSLPLPEVGPGPPKLLLDIGCNWGRWCFAAAKKGYRVIGSDPSIHAVMAAQRISSQLGLDNISFVVADGRHLPFEARAFDNIFSYGVLQHFSKENVLAALRQIRAVLKDSGLAFVQMPNRYGIRCLYNQLHPSIKKRGGIFRVRYWGPQELKAAFRQEIGPSRLSVDGFFTLNAQEADLWMLPRKSRLILRMSLALKSLSNWIPLLLPFADSLYIESRLAPDPNNGGRP